jgi:hypothetical protein
MARLMKATNTDNPAAFARAVGKSPESVYPVIKKGKIPPGWIVAVSEGFGVSSDWLLTGQGPMMRADLQGLGQSAGNRDFIEFVQDVEAAPPAAPPGIRDEMLAAQQDAETIITKASENPQSPERRLIERALHQVTFRPAVFPTYRIPNGPDGKKIADLQAEYGPHVDVPRLDRSSWWGLFHWYIWEIQDDPDMRGWFKIEFNARFPEFKRWAKTKAEKPNPPEIKEE